MSAEQPMCTICCERYTVRLRKHLSCPFCAFDACSECVRRYLTDDAAAARPLPDCMSCHRAWSLSHMDAMFPRAFVDGALLKHRVHAIYQAEVAMMPATQPAVERMLRLRRLRLALSDAKASVAMLEADIMGIEGAPIFATSTATYIRPCPSPSGCKGFVDQQSCACGICGVRTCRACHVMFGDAAGEAAHVCNSDDVASTSRIARETRACPGCSSSIFKINGCDQMFCTKCHTAFSWNTGAVDVGRVHNPHYYTLHAAGAPHENDAPPDFEPPCGGMPSYAEIRRVCRRAAPLVCMSRLADVHQRLTHVEVVDLRQVRDGLPALNVQRFLQERMHFMTGELSEARFRDCIERNEKWNHRVTAIAEILSMFSTTGADVFRNLTVLCTAPNTSAVAIGIAMNAACDQAEELREYANAQLQHVARRFGGEVLQTMPDWTPGGYSVKHGVQQREAHFTTDDDDDDDDEQAAPPHADAGPFMIRLHHVDMREFMTNIRRRMP